MANPVVIDPPIEWNVSDWETLEYALSDPVERGDQVTVQFANRAIKMKVMDVVKAAGGNRRYRGSE